jgi:8-oxo-dGTP pyrophosphatase MutT (NUDIX family)
MFMLHSTRNHLVDRIRRAFGGAPCRLQVAALPWRRNGDGIEVLLVTSRETRRWVLPKGWPEGREDLHAAAAREAGEEAGVSGDISPREAGRFYYDKIQPSGAAMRCQVLVFPMEVDHVADKWRERKKRERAWFSPSEAAAHVREPDLAELIERFDAHRFERA